MRHIAIIGSGPAGFYTAEALLKLWGDGVRVDVIDKLPVPYGLIRTGVAPDHQSIKAVAKRYEATAEAAGVRFVGNVAVGRDVTVPELLGLYHAVVIATGAPQDRVLDLPGADLPGVVGSAAFVGWYNGHPGFAGLKPDLSGTDAVVIGMGNVALDVTRILAKTTAEFAGSDIVSHALDTLAQAGTRRITVVGRRGPHQIMMTPKELGELARLDRAAPRVDPADLPDPLDDALLEPGIRKSVNHLRGFADGGADKPVTIGFDFFAAPRRLIGTTRVEAIELEVTRVEAGRAVPTGEVYTIPAQLVVACIGYQSSPLEGVPFDTRRGCFANDEGRILPGLYCVGWAQRGPSGTIGTNRPGGFAVVDLIAQDLDSGAHSAPGREGAAALDRLLAARGVDAVSFADWKRIEAAETARARDGAPREKFVDTEAMIAAIE